MIDRREQMLHPPLIPIVLARGCCNGGRRRPPNTWVNDRRKDWRGCSNQEVPSCRHDCLPETGEFLLGKSARFARGSAFSVLLARQVSPRRRGGVFDCCARAASGHAAAAPPSAASNFRRPMVTVIRPSSARCVNATIPRNERAVLTAWPPARSGRARRAQAATERRQALEPGATRPGHQRRRDPMTVAVRWPPES